MDSLDREKAEMLKEEKAHAELGELIGKCITALCIGIILGLFIGALH